MQDFSTAARRKDRARQHSRPEIFSTARGRFAFHGWQRGDNPDGSGINHPPEQHKKTPPLCPANYPLSVFSLTWRLLSYYYQNVERRHTFFCPPCLHAVDSRRMDQPPSSGAGRKSPVSLLPFPPKWNGKRAPCRWMKARHGSLFSPLTAKRRKEKRAIFCPKASVRSSSN